MGQRSDEAKPAAGLLDPHVAGRPAGPVIDVLERVAIGEPGARQRQRQVLVEPGLARLAKRHHLDQRQVHAAAVRPGGHVGDLVLVDALERHGVDLDLQARLLRGIDAGHDLVEIAPAGDCAKLVRVERVDRDVDAFDAVTFQFGCVLLELRTVRRQRQLVQRAALEMARQRLHQRHDAPAHQRFAAGQPELSDTLGDEGAAQPVEFLEREQVGLRQEGHVLRHAVDAAEIAAVRDGDAEVGDGAGKRVDQRPRA